MDTTHAHAYPHPRAGGDFNPQLTRSPPLSRVEQGKDAVPETVHHLIINVDGADEALRRALGPAASEVAHCSTAVDSRCPAVPASANFSSSHRSLLFLPVACPGAD